MDSKENNQTIKAEIEKKYILNTNQITVFNPGYVRKNPTLGPCPALTWGAPLLDWAAYPRSAGYGVARDNSIHTIQNTSGTRDKIREPYP